MDVRAGRKVGERKHSAPRHRLANSSGGDASLKSNSSAASPSTATGRNNNVSSSSPSQLQVQKRQVEEMKQTLGKLSKEELISKILGMEVLKRHGPPVADKKLNMTANSTDCREEMSSSTVSATPSSLESQRRDRNMFVLHLAAKEQELADCLNQIHELRTSLGTGLRNSLLDPVVNLLFEKMKAELTDAKKKLDESQQELNAWKFTPDSNTGKRLMLRCRRLMEENDELGQMVEVGRLARLESQLALTQQQNQQLTEGQSEVDEFLLELDEDMEGLQATVLLLQTQLEQSRQESEQLRETLSSSSSLNGQQQSVTAKLEPPAEEKADAVAAAAGGDSRWRNYKEEHRTTDQPAAVVAFQQEDGNDEVRSSFVKKRRLAASARKHLRRTRLAEVKSSSDDEQAEHERDSLGRQAWSSADRRRRTAEPPPLTTATRQQTAAGQADGVVNGLADDR